MIKYQSLRVDLSYRKRERKTSTFIQVFDFESSRTVVFDNKLGHIQTQTGPVAFFFGCKIRVEDTRKI
jgi:hypothetical protein